MRHFNPRPLISFSTYLLSCSTSTRSPDLVRHVGICTGLSLQRKLWLNSFNPRPLSSSQRNAEPKCKNTNAPSLLLSYVHKCGCSDNPVSNPIYRSLDSGSYDPVEYLARVKLALKVRVEVPQAMHSGFTVKCSISFYLCCGMTQQGSNNSWSTVGVLYFRTKAALRLQRSSSMGRSSFSVAPWADLSRGLGLRLQLRQVIILIGIYGVASLR